MLRGIADHCISRIMYNLYFVFFFFFCHKLYISIHILGYIVYHYLLILAASMYELMLG